MLKDIFTPEVIQHYKTNKNLITSELLAELRSHGNEGKDIALEILDTEKSEDNFYLDAFGEKISNNGNRDQKKAFTQMKLSKIHLEEIERCKNDLMYFKDNYVKILTKSGYTFPETRPYQVEFLKDMDGDDENIVSLQGRQSGKSITVSIYLAHKFNFGQNMNIGICANKGPLAREFLNNVKNIFEALPMWMRVGVTVWNKGSIESEAKMRILTDVPGPSAFRGFTCAILVIDECAFIRSNVWKEMEDSVFPSQSALGWKKNIIISTPNGVNHFKKIVDGAKNKTNGFKYHFVNWRDVPRYDSKGNLLTPEQFKEKTIKKHGEKFFLQNYQCVEYNSKINIFDTLNNKEFEISIGDFYNNKLSSNRFKVLTSEGFSDFEGIRKTKADKTLKITLEDNNQIEVSENHIFIIQSKNIKANTLKIGDYLEVKNNILKRILNIEIKNEQKDVFDIIETKNHSYFANNILNHNCSFLGSSLTLPSAETLDKLSNSTKEPEYLRDSRLKIYKEPQKDHIYFLAVDPAKSGEDAFAIQIVDLTSKPFEQVATAQLFKCNFQKMPVFIVEWGEIYNNAFIIIENNEGAGTYISSVLKLSYDYPNLFYEKKKGKIADLEPGFRTTQKTRPQILDILKSFLDDEILILHDAETVSELSTFILKNDKYQADDGCHDDLVMSLALIFAPFCDIKNFDDIEWVISYLYDPEKACKDTSKFYEHFVIGNFDSFDDDSYELSNKMSEYDDSDFGDFSQLEDGFDDYYNNY